MLVIVSVFGGEVHIIVVGHEVMVPRWSQTTNMQLVFVLRTIHLKLLVIHIY